MQIIFVQVKCEPSRSYEVAHKIMDEVEEVGELHSTSGKFDLLAKFHLDDRVDVGPRLVDGTMDKPLEIGLSMIIAGGTTIKLKLHDVRLLHKLRAARTGQ